MAGMHTYTNVVPAAYENLTLTGELKLDVAKEKELYGNFPLIAAQLNSMLGNEGEEEEQQPEMPTNYRPNPMYGRDKLRQSLRFRKTPGAPAQAAAAGGAKDGKLGFEENHPVWEMLRLTAFLCLGEKFGTASALLKETEAGFYCLQKSQSQPKTINLVVKTADNLATYEIKRKVNKKFIIFDTEFRTLHDLIAHFQATRDARIPHELIGCCTALDDLIEKHVNNFLAQPSVSEETFTLKALVLTICNMMRERYCHASIVPFMPHWLEYALLPSDQSGLSLAPTKAGSGGGGNGKAAAAPGPPPRSVEPDTAPVKAPRPRGGGRPALPKPPALRMDLGASRQEAESCLLSNNTLGAYIIRKSKTLEDKMALSVLVRPGLIEHFQATILPSKRILLKSGREYASWEELVGIHTKEVLPKVGITLTINCHRGM